MRVIEPKHRHKQTQKTKEHHEKGTHLALGLAMLILVGMFVFGYRSINAPPAKETATESQQIVNYDQPKKGILKTFTGQQFKDLYEKFAYPNTQTIDMNSPITGNTDSDDKIRELAKARGYLIRSAPVSDTFVPVAPNMKLQEKAAQPWLDMQSKARESGQIMKLTAAYRAAEDQKTIFIDRLISAGVKMNNIPSGLYDSQINKVLSTTAPPGYSRHHSGYTVDIACDNDPYVTFERSLCFEWLSANNYENTKKFGWIPSYPIGTIKQGPEPEAWEYVWVGKDALTE